MIKPYNLQKGDKVAIVSLSLGLLGEESAKHELEIGLKRIKEFGLVPVIMPNSLKGIEYLFNHPEERASDLKQAFLDDSIKAIITAIGGDDTYKLIPYLMNDKEFCDAVLTHPKIFIGFSDTTNNHLMFYRLGLKTFYGPCFIVDFAELDKEMLPYTRDCLEKLFLQEERFEIKSSPVWYLDRKSFGIDQIGVPRIEKKEEHGYEVLKGSGKVSGILYGGCIESFYDDFVGLTYQDMPEIINKYHIILENDEWNDKIFFIEPSEQKMSPEVLFSMLMEFKKRNIFKRIRGLIVGKSQDEAYYEEYKKVYLEVFNDLDTPILYNVNFGHAFPRCIIPYGAKAVVDYDEKKIIIDEPILEKRKILKK